MKHDIDSLDHVKQLVDTFYGEIQKDLLIGGIFMGIIQDWPKHLQKMYTFWQTVLLGEYTYHGSPFPPHAQMPLQAIHFERWLLIWRNTIDCYFEGEKAEEAKWRGEKMASMFLSKIEYYRTNNKKPLL